MDMEMHERAEIKTVATRKRRDWELLVRECESKGVSWKEFCVEKGLNYIRFRRWVGVFAREKMGLVGDRKFQEINLNVGRRFNEVLNYEVELGGVKVCFPVGFNELEVEKLLRLVGRL